MMADFVTAYENDQSISRRCLSTTNYAPDDQDSHQDLIDSFIAISSVILAACERRVHQLS